MLNMKFTMIKHNNGDDDGRISNGLNLNTDANCNSHDILTFQIAPLANGYDYDICSECLKGKYMLVSIVVY